jgi:hypothetical protein
MQAHQFGTIQKIIEGPLLFSLDSEVFPGDQTRRGFLALVMERAERCGILLLLCPSLLFVLNILETLNILFN